VNHKLKVLFIAAEASPFVKVGGLADVVGPLATALAQRGVDVRVVLPHYSFIDDATKWKLLDIGRTVTVEVKGKSQEGKIWKTYLDNTVPVYLVDNPYFFHRSSVYGEKDDLDRFLFLSLASLAVPAAISWQPQVVHLHDWHAAFAASLLNKTEGRPATVLTIHNLAYQGWFDYQWATETALAGYIPGKEHPFHAMLWSAMGLGIFYTDLITTVSRTYAGEILSPQYGKGLHPLLRHREKDLTGIINGLDCQEYNPSTDPFIPQHYSAFSPEKKAVNKAALQQRLGLPVEGRLPLVGSVGRITDMKGTDIMLQVVEELLPGQRFQFALLGTGDKNLETIAQRLSEKYPHGVSTTLEFNAALAHLIYAGCDIFFMPSRFEPCGLGQLIAMRYGAIPVVHRTGGLAETVVDANKQGTGFLFDGFSAQAAAQALSLALEAYHRKASWVKTIMRAMSQDFSWEKSAAEYEQVYRRALSAHSPAG
jgi:starch synthase